MSNKVLYKPTVSIILVTYHSAAFVRETLESIKAQDYDRIELVITDDCSGDDTVAVLREWLDHPENVQGFTRVKLVTNEKNLGVAGNCNAGLAESTGDWIKLIAGDDLLLPTCISTFVAAMQQQPDAKIMVSKLKLFRDQLENQEYVWPLQPLDTGLEQQFRYQLRGSYMKAPAVIMNASVLKGFGGFDERMPFLEDDPMWIKFLQHGYPFTFVPKVLVAYRLHTASISNGTGAKYMSVLFFNSLKKYKEIMALPLLKEKGMWFWHFLVKLELDTMQEIIDGGNHGQLSFKHKVIFKVVSVLREQSRKYKI